MFLGLLTLLVYMEWYLVVVREYLRQPLKKKKIHISRVTPKDICFSTLQIDPIEYQCFKDNTLLAVCVCKLTLSFKIKTSRPLKRKKK